MSNDLIATDSKAKHKCRNPKIVETETEIANEMQIEIEEREPDDDHKEPTRFGIILKGLSTPPMMCPMIPSVRAAKRSNVATFERDTKKIHRSCPLSQCPSPSWSVACVVSTSETETEIVGHEM